MNNISVSSTYVWGNTDRLTHKCDGYKIIGALEKMFGLGFYEYGCCMTENGIVGAERQMIENEIRISSVHAYVPRGNDKNEEYPSDTYSLCSFNPKKRILAIEELKRNVEIADWLGSKRVVVHSGFLSPTKKREDHLKFALESLEEVVSFIKSNNYDVVLGVENGLYQNQPFVTVKEFEALTPLYPYAGMWIDTGHAFVNKLTDQYLLRDVCKDILVGMHVHNNGLVKDNHRAITEGKIDVLGYLRPILGRIDGENLPIVLEIKKDTSSKESIKQSIGLLREIIN